MNTDHTGLELAFIVMETDSHTQSNDQMSLDDQIRELGTQAKAASHALGGLGADRKNCILDAMADALDAGKDAIQAANAKDLEAGRDAGLTAAMLDRLELTDARVGAMSRGLRDIIALPDPVGEKIKTWTMSNGIVNAKTRVPIGVIGIIYESRPNVTADAAALCFKAGNAVILRGGREALHSNAAIADVLQAGGVEAGMPDHAVQLIRTTDRDAVRALVQLAGLVDMIIPRGGEGLIRAVSELAHVPVLKHYKGVCHTYVDESADLEMAMRICENAKCQRPGVCNAMETLLVHQAIAPVFLPKIAERFVANGVELRGDASARGLVPSMNEATEEDWYEEYLDLILAVRVVPDVAAAIAHINQYGSQHSDAIVAESATAQDIFTREVDAATVYVNASTRFTDGAEFGLGAEIGISTDMLHARGPMGLEELTTYKYILRGEGQIKT